MKHARRFQVIYAEVVEEYTQFDVGNLHVSR